MSKPETVQSIRGQLDFWEKKLENAKSCIRTAFYSMTFFLGNSIPNKKFCLKKHKRCKLSMFSTRRTIRIRERVLSAYARSLSLKAERMRKTSRVLKTKVPFYEAKIALLKKRMENLKATQFVLES